MSASTNHPSNPSRGFTLIELTVAIALAALITFGVSTILGRASAAGKKAELLTRAVMLAQAQIETALGADYGALTVGAFEPRQALDAPFERATTVQFLDPTTLQVTDTDRGLKKIAVAVFYPAAAQEQSVVLSTIITNH